ncbi:hypothetical protein N9164_10310 [Draconibacterium sp.]|nr:hypothetical protein [Draconibacterium sp.]
MKKECLATLLALPLSLKKGKNVFMNNCAGLYIKNMIEITPLMMGNADRQCDK